MLLKIQSSEITPFFYNNFFGFFGGGGFSPFPPGYAFAPNNITLSWNFFSYTAFAISAFAAFGPKFMQSQYSLSSGDADRLMGFAVATGMMGALLGGAFIRRYNLDVRGLIKTCICCIFISMLLSLAFLIRCAPTRFVGVNQNYFTISTHTLNGATTGPLGTGPTSLSGAGPSGPSGAGSPGSVRVETVYTVRTSPYGPGSVGLVETRPFQGVDAAVLAAPCNQMPHCVSCDVDMFKPICGSDGVIYYSPCYAGCTSTEIFGSSKASFLLSVAFLFFIHKFQ